MSTQTQRFHSFDAFRTVLAISGVILHAYYFHLIFTLHQGSFDSVMINAQSKGSDFLSILSLWIHSFRMPAFFAISGFFSFYLLNRIGHRNTLLNRCKRILIPFLILWLAPLIFSAIELLIAHAGRAGFYQGFNDNLLTYVGTFWFLYFLLIMDALLLLVFVPLFKREPIKNVRFPETPSSRGTTAESEFVQERETKAVTAAAILAALILGTISCAIISKAWFTSASISIIPAPTTLVYYGLFFIFGCVAANVYPKLSLKYKKTWPYALMLSLLLITAYWILFSDFHQSHIGKLSAEFIWGILPWIMIIGLFFFFESLASKPSKIWRYLSDSSYWIYIAQMPIVMVLSLFLSIPLAILSTLAILFISYQLLIRNRRCFSYIDGAYSKELKEVNNAQ